MPMDWVALTPHSITDYTGPPTLANAYVVTWGKASGYAALFVAIWAAIVALLRGAGCGEMICGVRRGSWALKTAMLVHHTVITPLAFIGIFEDPVIVEMYRCFGCSDAATQMNRAAAPPNCARALTPVTLGYFIGDLLLLSQWSLTKSGAVENCLMIFHHIASLVVWPAAVYFDWVARYVIIMLSYEFTGIWLTLLWMLSTAGLKKHLAYKLVGLTFTLSFVLMRLVGAVPQLIALFNSPPWTRAQELLAEPKGIHDWCWIFSASLVFPHLLNFFWGAKVVNGFLSLILGGGKQKGGKEKEK